MTFGEWIRYIVKVDKALTQISKTCLKRKKNRISEVTFAKRYCVQGHRGRHSRVVTKTSNCPNLLLYLICITSANNNGNKARFDSDSFIIGVDNNAFKTIYNHISCFIRNFWSLPHKHIKGISGQISIKGQVTVRYNIEDDEGKVNTLDIKDAIYVPKSPLYILCPQNWSQQANGNFPTWIVT